MRDLSMSILDLAMNSIRAHATVIEIKVAETLEWNELELEIKDNGVGMSSQVCKEATYPFFTTKSNHRVGLGIPLLIERAKQCEGNVLIQSREGIGTSVRAKMKLNHLDRPPFGNIHQTLYTIIQIAPTVNLIYMHQKGSLNYRFETLSVREVVGEKLMNHPNTIAGVKREIETNDFSFTSY